MNTRTSEHFFMFYLIFFINFAIFLFTMFPSVAIYRDAGEMVSVSFTFGIAHPPGYPLYVLLGKIFTLIIPFGNIAYRVNIMSAFFGALTCGVVYKIVSRKPPSRFACGEEVGSSNNQSPLTAHDSRLPAFISAMVLAFSTTFWSVSLVAEMYTLNTFFIALIIYILLLMTRHLPLTTYYLPLAAFLFGLAMGNRIDIVLIAPGILFWLISGEIRKLLSFAKIITCTVLFILGLSVFLFLPVRSKTQPVLNWNKPDNIQTLLNTITRKTHGRTLDLISSRYTIGDVFASEMKVYGKRTFKLFTILGIPFIILGIASFYKKRKTFFTMTFLAYLVSGPVFIAIAKMPPNPHALAIMDPHYLIPDLMLVLWFGGGIYFAAEKLKKYSFALLAVPIWLFISNFSNQNMRFNFTAYDFTRNVFRSVPRNAIVISREDIQLFSQWYLQFIENRREDIALVAKGLSESEWYRQMLKKYKNVELFSLKQPDTFLQFYKLNEISSVRPTRQIYFTSDVEDYEMLGGKFPVYPHGIAFNIKDTDIKGYTPVDYENLYIFRGPINPELYPDFFTQKIITQYADSLQRAAMFFMKENRLDKAEEYFKKTLLIKNDTASIYFNLGWIYSQKGDIKNTEYYYKESIKFYEKLHAQALEYKSFPEVVESIISDWAVVHNNLGTIYEKQNRLDEAVSEYLKALRIKPGYADAHYNIAVTYWHRENWQEVIRNLEETLKFNPNHTDARKYLYLARQKLK